MRFGSKLLSGVIALLLSLITIGIVWLHYRPLIGLAVLALAGLVLVLFSRLKNKAKITTEAKK
jgi:Flp pilus assembly protein TadB